MKNQLSIINLKDQLPKMDPKKTFFVCRINIVQQKQLVNAYQSIPLEDLKKIIAKRNLKKVGGKLMINRTVIPNVFVHFKTDAEWFPVSFVKIEWKDKDPINLEKYSSLSIFDILS